MNNKNRMYALMSWKKVMNYCPITGITFMVNELDVKRHAAYIASYMEIREAYQKYRNKVISKLYKNKRGFWKRKQKRRYVIHG